MWMIGNLKRKKNLMELWLMLKTKGSRYSFTDKVRARKLIVKLYIGGNDGAVC